MRSGRRTSGFL